MKIEVISLDEETGVCQLNVDDEGKQYLIAAGFNAILMQGLRLLMEKENGTEVSGVSGDCSPTEP